MENVDLNKLKTPLIKVAGIALKDRVDLISIVVPLEVIAEEKYIYKYIERAHR